MLKLELRRIACQLAIQKEMEASPVTDYIIRKELEVRGYIVRYDAYLSMVFESICGLSKIAVPAQ
jgi:hypothetical protein